MSAETAQPRQYLPRGEDFLLLSPSWQAYAYRNVDRIFATRAIARGEAAFPWRAARRSRRTMSSAACFTGSRIISTAPISPGFWC